MAVNKCSNQFGQPQIEQEVDSSSEEGRNVTSPGIFQLKKSNGHFIVHQNIREGTSGYKNMHNPTKTDESGSLSDIDDAEVNEYLNSKEQIQYKRILWEAINSEYLKAKKPKKRAELKTSVSVKRAAKATAKIEKKGPSSKIDYDALRKLADELDQGLENGDQQL